MGAPDSPTICLSSYDTLAVSCFDLAAGLTFLLPVGEERDNILVAVEPVNGYLINIQRLIRQSIVVG
jgi:hypothetical protein